MKRRFYWLAALLVACSSSPQKDEQALVGPQEPVKIYPDPGPSVDYAGGARSVDLQEANGKVEATHCEGGYCYARVSAERPLGAGTLSVEASNYGIAFGRSDGAALVRFVGEVPTEFQLHYVQNLGFFGSVRQPAARTRIRILNDSSKQADKKLITEFWNAAAARVGGETAFRRFVSARALRRSQPETAPERQRRLTEAGAVMELYTGMTSVREALQYDRGLGVARDPAATLDLTQVEGIELRVHPWQEMIASLPNKPVIEALAKVVPDDMAYMHFHDLRSFVALARELDEWITPLAQSFEQQGGATHFVEAYERQLVVERTGLSETLGHIATDGIALLVGDAFLREGTDISLVFKVKNRTALVAALAGFEANARKARPDLDEARWKVGEHVVRRLYTPDGDIEQNRVELGDHLIISNSRGAIRHIIDAFEGRTGRLADSGDFQYLRARYPFDAKAEDGFVFISDAFVAHAVSPRTKILAGRRMHAQADLLAVQHGIMMHGWFEGKEPNSIKDAQDKGYLTADLLKHADGQAIGFDERGALSGWGRVRLMTPLRDLPLEKVSEDEKSSYDQFRQTYQMYWRAMIDPIGAQIRRTAEGFSMDARMLPIIDSSDYNNVRELVGQARVMPRTAHPGFHWVGAIGENARLRQQLDGAGRAFLGGRFATGWLGDWVAIGVLDRSGLQDLALYGLRHAMGSPEKEDDVMRLFARLPAYLLVHLKNPLVLGTVLTSLKTMAEESAPGMLQWGQTDPYGEVPIVRVGTSDQGGLISGEFAILYATVNDIFIVAMERTTLEMQIDAVLDGKVPTKVSDPLEPGTQSAFQGSLKNNYLKTALLALVESDAPRSQQKVQAAYEDLARSVPGLNPLNTRTKGLALLGFEPFHFHGGELSLTPYGAMHSIYGSASHVRWPAVPVEDSPVTKLIQSLESLEMSLEFEGEGDHQGIRARFGITRSK